MVKRFKNINPKDVENVKLRPGNSEHFCGTPLEKVPKSLRHAHKEIGRALKSIIKERVKSKKNSRLTLQPIITIPVMFHLYKRNNDWEVPYNSGLNTFQMDWYGDMGDGNGYTLSDDDIIRYINTVNAWLSGESGNNKKWKLGTSSFNENKLPSLEILGDYSANVPNFADTNSDTRVRIELLKAIPVDFLRRFMVPTQSVKDIHATSATAPVEDINYPGTHTTYNENIAINFSKDHNEGAGSGKIFRTLYGSFLKNLAYVDGFQSWYSMPNSFFCYSTLGSWDDVAIPFPTYYPLTFTENPLLERRKDEAIANYNAAKLAYEDDNNATTRANLETAKHIKDLGGFVSCGVDGLGSIIRYDDSLNPTGLKEFLNGDSGHFHTVNPACSSDDHFIPNPLYLTPRGNSSNFRFQRYNLESIKPLYIDPSFGYDFTINGNDSSKFPLYANNWENNSGEPLGYYQTPINAYLLEEYFYTLPCIHVHDYLDYRGENGQISNAHFPTNVIGSGSM